jgi:HSP20 family protein
MKLMRYNPLNDFSGNFGELMENVLRSTSQNETSFLPAVDIIKNEKDIELSMIAPGMEKADFIIDIDDNNLTISGERKFNKEANYTKVESQYGSFKRTFKLNDDIEKEEIKASYINGVLKLVLPLNVKKIEKATIKVN